MGADEKPVIMFGGKGGVGKTTCAAATALGYAGLQVNTLVISTDPTPSLADIFEVRGTEKPIRISDNLHLAELGIDEVKDLWHQRFGREVYEVFSSMVSIEYDEFVDFITSILPGLQEEFMVDYIRDLVDEARYEKIIWDTAPLGQTMHLLNMPGMMLEHLKPAPRIYSRLKLGGISRRPILKILEEWSVLSQLDIRFLCDKVEYKLVTIPEALAVAQINGIIAEFSRHGFGFSEVIVNNVIMSPDSEFLKSKSDQQQAYIERIQRLCAGRKIRKLPLFQYEIMGIDRLREIAARLFAKTGADL